MKNEIKSGAVLGYINMFANILITFVYTPIMLRLMGNEEYGLYSLVLSVIAYLSVLDMGFGNAMIRFISKSQANKDNKKESKISGMFLMFYTIIGIVTVVIGIILISKIRVLFPALSENEIYKAKIIMGILIGTVAVSFPLSVFESYVMACERFKFLKILNIIKTVSIPLTMLPLLLCGFKSITMVIVTSFYNIAYQICTLICCVKKLNMKISFSIKEFDKGLFKEICSYSVFIFLGLIVDTVFNNTDQVILGSLCGTVAVAIYAVGTKFSSMNVTFSTTISGLFLPKITKMLEENDSDKKISDLFIKISRIQIYLMMLIMTGFIILGRQFIDLWVGSDYKDAYYIILLLIVPAIVPLTQNIGISIIQAKNKHQFRAIAYLIIAVINIMISIPLAQKHGGIGAAVGTAVANFLGQIMTMNIFYWKKINLDIPKYWRFLLAFSAKLGIIVILNMWIVSKFTFNWYKLILFAGLFAIQYMVIVFFTLNKEEKQLIGEFKRKIVFAKGK